MFSKNIFLWLGFPDLDSATFNWPWEKTGLGRYIPTFCDVCPCYLFIDMTYASLIGNCLLLNTIVKLESEGIKSSLGI